MILRLVREQLRSQWRYTAWSAGLLAFALALATYAMVTGATVIAQQDEGYEFSPREHAAFFETVIGPGPADIDHGVAEVHRLGFEELDALIAEASPGVHIEAAMGALGRAESYPDWLSVVAVSTPIRWDRYLASGAPPGHGEAAISSEAARALGLGVGDPVTLDAIDTRGPARSMTFVISGTLKAGNVAPYWTNLPADVYVPWSDAREVAVGLPNWRSTDEATGVVTTIVSTQVMWDGDSGALAPYEAPDDSWVVEAEGFSFGRALSNANQAGYWSLAAAGLAALGMMVAAFGMGRAQAEARTKWAATARVLGATRRTVATSSAIETVIVSLAGIAVGLAAGIVAVAAHLAALRAMHPEALLPSGPSVPPALLLAGVAIGLVIAAVVAAVPAFWASRVAPVAALKSVTPVGEATVSKDVSKWWLPGTFTAGALIWSALFWGYERGDYSDTDVITLAMWISFVVVVVSAAALVLEIARGLVRRVGAVLSRSRRPWLIAAGDGLSAHHRIFTFASLAMLVLCAAFAWTVTANATRAFDPYPLLPERGEPPLPSFETWWGDQLTGAGMAGSLALVTSVVTFVAVTVTVSSRATFAGDAATRGALGLSANGERVATAARQWAVMGAASIVGALLGWAAPLMTRLGGAVLSPKELVYSWNWNVTVALWGLAATGVIIAVALAVTLAGSLAVGLLARPRTPVEALKRKAG